MSSEIIDIKELKKQADAKSLQEFAVSQQHLIDKLTYENKRLQEKLSHLEQVLQQLQMVEGAVQRITPEELICIEQINILHNRSSQRELTLDEVKRLDLLIKNLRLIREVSTQVIDSVGHRDVKDEDLVRLAAAPESADQ